MHGDMISIQPQGWIQPCNCRNNNKIKYCRVSRLAIDKLRYLNDWWQTKVFLMKSTTIVMYILMLYLGAQYFLVCSNFSQSNCKFSHYRPCRRGKCCNVQENQPNSKGKGQEKFIMLISQIEVLNTWILTRTTLLTSKCNTDWIIMTPSKCFKWTCECNISIICFP